MPEITRVYEDLPILPEPFRYAPIPGKEAALDNVKRLMAREDVTEIVNACDAGREGELIFRLVYELAGCRKPVLRLWISSMEDSAIREGFSELRPGAEYGALYQSALCRQRADWLVGINATRLFSVLYHRTLNVGRVQTPTLSLLATRDAKIALFQKEKYHHVRLTLAGAEAVSERFIDPAAAEQAVAMCKGATVTCTSVTCEQKKEQPPKLYDLTTLQREANRLLGYGVHHQSDDGKYLIMGNGTRAFAIPAQQPEQDNPLRTAEMTLEDDYGMIDGVINNGRRGEELEKAKEHAERTQPEKKPSIRERLAAAKQECAKQQPRPAPEKKPPELGER